MISANEITSGLLHNNKDFSGLNDAISSFTGQEVFMYKCILVEKFHSSLLLWLSYTKLPPGSLHTSVVALLVTTLVYHNSIVNVMDIGNTFVSQYLASTTDMGNNTFAVIGTSKPWYGPFSSFTNKMEISMDHSH